MLVTLFKNFHKGMYSKQLKTPEAAQILTGNAALIILHVILDSFEWPDLIWLTSLSKQCKKQAG